MDYPTTMERHEILRAAWDQATGIWSGVAIPCQKSTADGGTIQSEKVLKFTRSALTPQKKERANPRLSGGDDHMIQPVGKPGSRERLAALAAHYSEGGETSPFAD